MDIQTRKKISRTMKGKSNFEGKRHTHSTKIQIGISQEGHKNAKDHKWVTDKESGQEHRVKGKLPRGMRWGRKSSLGEAVWDNPSPAKKPNRLSAVMKARAKARAKAAGRPYPNMVDNIWAARNESESSAKRLEGTDSLRKIYTKDTPGQKNMKIDEAKATYCGRCGTTHVAPKFGGTCPALKEEQIVEESSASLKKMSDYHFKQASYHDKEAMNTEHPTERRKAHALALSSHNNAGEHYLKASRADNELAREYHTDKAERYADSAEEREREHNLMEETVTELNKSTLASYLDKTVDPVYGMPRTTAKLMQRLAGVRRASKKLSEIKEGQQSIDEAPSIYSTYMSGRGRTGMVGKKPNASDMATYGTYNVTIKHSEGEKKYTLKNMNDGRHAQNVAMKIHSKQHPEQRISTASADKVEVKEESSITEVSRKTLGRYMGQAKASQMIAIRDAGWSRETPEIANKHRAIAKKRAAGLAKAHVKWDEKWAAEKAADKAKKQGLGEDTISEVSKRLLGRYIEKAATSMSSAAFGQGQASASLRPPSEKDQKTGMKRMVGIARATSRLTKEEKDVPFEGPYTKTKGTERDKSGAVHTPMSRARHLARLAMKSKKLREETINELSKSTLSNYASDAALDAVRHGNNLGRAQLSGSNKLANAAGDKITKRLDGIKKAISKINK